MFAIKNLKLCNFLFDFEIKSFFRETVIICPKGVLELTRFELARY